MDFLLQKFKRLKEVFGVKRVALLPHNLLPPPPSSIDKPKSSATAKGAKERASRVRDE